jgi:NitT/TauT family transport system permease protein
MTSNFNSANQPATFKKHRHLEPTDFWQIRQDIPTRLKAGMLLLGVGIPLLLWSVLSYGKLVTPMFLPSPSVVLATGWRMITQENLLLDLLASGGRAIAGFLLASLIGVPLGLLVGTFPSLEKLFAPVMGSLRYMPINAFVPLIVIWVGLGENAKVSIIALGIVLYAAVLVADAVRYIPNDLINVAYTLGANRRNIFFKVIIPAVLPSILDSMRVSIASAWNYVVIAEIVAAQSGLGFRILQSQRYIQTDKVLFCILVIGLVGLVTDLGIRQLERAIVPWAEKNSR